MIAAISGKKSHDRPNEQPKVQLRRLDVFQAVVWAEEGEKKRGREAKKKVADSCWLWQQKDRPPGKQVDQGQLVAFSRKEKKERPRFMPPPDLLNENDDLAVLYSPDLLSWLGRFGSKREL